MLSKHLNTNTSLYASVCLYLKSAYSLYIICSLVFVKIYKIVSVAFDVIVCQCGRQLMNNSAAKIKVVVTHDPNINPFTADPVKALHFAILV